MLTSARWTLSRRKLSLNSSRFLLARMPCYFQDPNTKPRLSQHALGAALHCKAKETGNMVHEVSPVTCRLADKQGLQYEAPAVSMTLIEGKYGLRAREPRQTLQSTAKRERLSETSHDAGSSKLQLTSLLFHGVIMKVSPLHVHLRKNPPSIVDT